jgi:hypothetical protein
VSVTSFFTDHGLPTAVRCGGDRVVRDPRSRRDRLDCVWRPRVAGALLDRDRDRDGGRCSCGDRRRQPRGAPRSTPSLQGGGRSFAHLGNGRCALAGPFARRRVTAFGRAVSGDVARRRDASRLPRMYPRRTRVLQVQATTYADLQAFCGSPLTDSNRRPPPYHALRNRCRGLRPVADRLV